MKARDGARDHRDCTISHPVAPGTRFGFSGTRTACLCVWLVLVFVGCARSVKESGLSPQAGSRFFYIGRTSPKTLYTVEDEQVTYWAKFDWHPNPWVKNLRVEWIDPSGGVFLSREIETSWGTEYVVTRLPIKDNYPSRLPGDWKVRLYHGDDRLDEARFTIEERSGDAKAKKAK